MKKLHSLIHSFILICLTTTFVSSQDKNDDFIKILDKVKFKATEKQQKMLDKVTRYRTTKEVNYITLGDLSKAQKKGVLALKIPGIDKMLTFKATQVEAKSTTDYRWFGNLQEDIGSAIFISTKGKISGIINVQYKQYLIHSLDDEQYVLVEHDVKKLKTPHVCGTFDDKVKKPNSKKQATTLAECRDNNIRILFVHSPAAAQNFNINDIVNMGMAQLQQSLDNSQCWTNVELAGIREIGNIQEGGGPNGGTIGQRIESDRNELEINQNVQNARTLTQADLVVMLSNFNYADANGEIFGIAELGGVDINPFYSVVQAEDALNFQTFVHEVGHLLGVRHQQSNIISLSSNADNAPGSNHEFGFCIQNCGIWCGDINYFKTSTHSPVATRPTTSFVGGNEFVQVDNIIELPYFSNPDISIPIWRSNFWGPYIEWRALGSTNNNSTSTIRNLRGNVANYINSAGQNGPNGFFYTQQLRPENNCGTNLIATACGQDPLTYIWDISDDGGFSYNNWGSGSFVTFYFPPIAEVDIRLTILDGQGRQSIQYQHYVQHIDCYNNQLRVAAKENSSEEPVAEELSLSIAYPNPANEVSTVTYSVPDEQEVSLQLFNVEGLLLQTIANGKHHRGKYEKKITTQTLSNGNYFYKLSNGKTVKSAKINVLH